MLSQSYIVQLRNKSEKLQHANQFRSFKANSDTDGAVFEGDGDFGNIKYVPSIQAIKYQKGINDS